MSSPKSPKQNTKIPVVIEIELRFGAEMFNTFDESGPICGIKRIPPSINNITPMRPKSRTGLRLHLKMKKRVSFPISDNFCLACRILFSVSHPSPSKATAKLKQLTIPMLVFPNKMRPKMKKGRLRIAAARNALCFGLKRTFDSRCHRLFGFCGFGCDVKTEIMNLNAIISNITRHTLPSPYLLFPKRRG